MQAKIILSQRAEKKEKWDAFLKVRQVIAQNIEVQRVETGHKI